MTRWVGWVWAFADARPGCPSVGRSHPARARALREFAGGGLETEESGEIFLGEGNPPVAWRRYLLQKVGHQCAFVSPLSGHRCQERRFLQFEHIRPLGKGGKHELINLTVLCRSHNLYRAVQEYGEKKMRPFFHPGWRQV